MSDYRMQHQPDPDGAQMHDLSEAFPDIYTHPEYYHHGSEHYDRSIDVIMRTKGDPEARVRIYRAVPDRALGINAGNWVTPSKTYAAEHGAHPTDPAQDWPVISKLVYARDLRTEGNDVNEWGYFPLTINAEGEPK